jgi:hypothetical protein
MRGHVRNVETAHRTVPLYQGDNRHLGRNRSIGTVSGFATDIGFVAFDGLAGSVQRLKSQRAEAHRFHAPADPVPEEPCGFHAPTDGPLDLPGGEPLLGRVQEIDHLQPDMQGDVGRPEDGPHPNGKLLPAGIALPQTRPHALALQPAGLADGLAVVANRPARPELRFDMGESGGLIL